MKDFKEFTIVAINGLEIFFKETVWWIIDKRNVLVTEGWPFCGGFLKVADVRKNSVIGQHKGNFRNLRVGNKLHVVGPAFE